MLAVNVVTSTFCHHLFNHPQGVQLIIVHNVHTFTGSPVETNPWREQMNKHCTYPWWSVNNQANDINGHAAIGKEFHFNGSNEPKDDVVCGIAI